MSTPILDPRERWLSLTCSGCRRGLHIKERYAHLRGRCPECGYRIQAPRPRPDAPPRAFSSDEPIRLEPIEEEWPEPALVDGGEEEKGGLYTVTPVSTTALPKPIGLDDEEMYRLAMPAADKSAPPPVAKFAAPYAMHGLTGEKAPMPPPVTYQLSQAELNPLRPPDPPAWPLWQGIYFYPWRLDTLFLWLTISAKFGVCSFIGCLIALFFDGANQETPNPVYAMALPIVIPVFCVVALWTGAYSSVQFLAILQDTAAGNDRVPRPEWTVWDGFMRFGFLAWVAAFSMVPSALLAVVLFRLVPAGPARVLALLLPAVLLYPVLLLSSMSSESPWMLLEQRFLSRLFAKPPAILALCIPPFVMFVPCALLADHAFSRFELLAAFLGGLLWSACFLIYARLLGRVAWYVTLRAPKAAMERKKRKKPSLT